MRLIAIFTFILFVHIVFSQDCKLVKDTVYTVDFAFKDLSKTTPSTIGIGYTRDIKQLEKINFSSKDFFYKSYCNNIDFAEERLSILIRIINSCYIDSTSTFKDNLIKNFIREQKKLTKNEYRLKIHKNKQFNIDIYVSRIIAVFVVIPFSEIEFKSLTRQIQPSCKNGNQKEIYRIKEIIKILTLSKEEKSFLKSLKSK